MLLVLLPIAPALVAEFVWCVIDWAPFRLTPMRLLVVSSVMSVIVVCASVVVVRAVGHAAASAGLSS